MKPMKRTAKMLIDTLKHYTTSEVLFEYVERNGEKVPRLRIVYDDPKSIGNNTFLANLDTTSETRIQASQRILDTYTLYKYIICI